MDFIKDLIELNNELELTQISKKIYTIDSDEEEDDIEYIKDLRKKFIKDYLKINNRQFKMVKLN